MQDGVVATVTERSEQRAFMRTRVCKHRQRLIGVGRYHHVIVAFGVAIAIPNFDPEPVAADRVDGGVQPNPVAKSFDQLRDVCSAPADDSTPDWPPSQFEQAVIVMKLNKP